MRRAVFTIVVLVSAACEREPLHGDDYYDRVIQPILTASCAGGTAPCHRDDGNGVALGNLDVTSYEALTLRRDALDRYGSYPEPLFLIKAVDSRDMVVPYRGDFFPLEVRHAGGAVLSPGSSAYLTLKTWLENGATRDGRPPPSSGGTGEGPCSTALSPVVDPASVDPAEPGYQGFDAAHAFLVTSCGAASCHGNPRADYYITCGETDEQKRFNYLMSRAFVAPTVDDSELLTRPLDPAAGGQGHSGGHFFPSRASEDYKTVRAWAALAGPLPVGPSSPARDFFESDVQPLLLRRGCAFLACHSPITPHKLNLRAGSTGFFSSIALDRNYSEAKKLLPTVSTEPRTSRLLAKNLLRTHGGILHRGGPILAGPPGPTTAADCPTPYDPTAAAPLCVLAEWLRLERQEVDPAYVTDLNPGARVPLVYVERPPRGDSRFVDFATYRPGADLIRADGVMGQAAALENVTGGLSLLDGCPGVGATRDDVDVRGPEPSYDGTRIVFAMRLGPSSGLDLYEVGVDGAGCRRLTNDGGSVANGILVHNFDPVYVVDSDGVEWIVYASTRGGAGGPTRTPKHFLPNADLWRQPLDGGPAERLTFLRGTEAQPGVMHTGQLILSAEKMSADFYQISGRRLNWDVTDYHPLLAQRAENYAGRGGYIPGAVPDEATMLPSIGYGQATEIRQALNGDFLVILADRDTYGEGGALGIFNRSIGPFEQGRDDPAFLPSLSVVPGPTGRRGDARGAFRSPYPLPDGTILASFAPGVDVAETSDKDYDLVVVDPVTGGVNVLRATPLAEVEPVLVVARPPPRPFTIKPTTNGATADQAVAHYVDLPLLATLLDSNSRRGRNVDALRDAAAVRFFHHRAPPPECTTPDHPACAAALAGAEAVYEAREDLGAAPLASDGSAFLRVPARQPVFLELLDADGAVIFRLREEIQFGSYEDINLGVPQSSFNTLCGVCHGSVSGRELEVTFTIDAVTTASRSTSRDRGPVDLR